MFKWRWFSQKYRNLGIILVSPTENSEMRFRLFTRRPVYSLPESKQFVLHLGFKNKWNSYTFILPWMRCSRVARASDSQCRSCNCPGFDPSILWNSGIWGAADIAVLNIVRKKVLKKSPENIIKKTIFAKIKYTEKIGYKRSKCIGIFVQMEVIFAKI